MYSILIYYYTTMAPCTFSKTPRYLQKFAAYSSFDTLTFILIPMTLRHLPTLNLVHFLAHLLRVSLTTPSLRFLLLGSILSGLRSPLLLVESLAKST